MKFDIFKRFALFCLLISSGLWANEAERLQWCKNANVKEFYIDETSTFESDFNYCEKKKSKLSKDQSNTKLKRTVQSQRVITLLRKLHNIQTIMGQSFSVPIQELFSKPIQIRFYADEYGALSSGSSKNYISLGVYSDWDGTYFPMGIFIHEIAHYLKFNPGINLPSPIKSFVFNSFLAETFSDKLAMDITKTNSLLGDATEYPNCLKEVRTAGSQSYDGPIFRYLDDFNLRKMVECCEKDLLSAENMSYNWSNACKKIVSRNRHFPPRDERLFKDLTDEEKKALPFDSHQIGLPLNAFLLNLQKKIPSKKIYRIILEGIAFMAQDQVEQKYLCTFKSKSTSVSMYSVVPLLRYLQDRLDKDEKEIFNELFTLHSLRRLRTVEKFAHERGAILAATPKLISTSQCADVAAAAEFQEIVSRPECELKCTLTKWRSIHHKEDGE